MTTEPLSFNSSAAIDATALVLPCDAEVLRRRLAPLGLTLRRPDFALPHQHPVCVECWSVVDGGFESLGWSQDEWFEGMGAAFGAVSAGLTGVALSAWKAAAVGGALGMALGPIAGFWGATSEFLGDERLASSAISGYRSGTCLGRDVSQAARRALGTYREVLVSVPYAQLAGSEQLLCFVLCMWSDNPVALWGDQVLGCGYRKRRARIHRQSPEQFDVYADAAATVRLLSCRTDSYAIDLPARSPERAALRAWFDQPLLGQPTPGTWALTRLERDLSAARTRVWTAPAALELGADTELAALLGGARSVARTRGAATWGAFHMQHMPVRLSNPWRP